MGVLFHPDYCIWRTKEQLLMQWTKMKEKQLSLNLNEDVIVRMERWVAKDSGKIWQPYKDKFEMKHNILAVEWILCHMLKSHYKGVNLFCLTRTVTFPQLYGIKGILEILQLLTCIILSASPPQHSHGQKKRWENNFPLSILKSYWTVAQANGKTFQCMRYQQSTWVCFSPHDSQNCLAYLVRFVNMLVAATTKRWQALERC